MKPSTISDKYFLMIAAGWIVYCLGEGESSRLGLAVMLASTLLHVVFFIHGSRKN